ncbi:oxidoreductase [Streptomyces sp. NPDC093065]|uniref:oxidoreductase n=1 Tax=Streptomyces sp. NPDC093065 TaxID=3366021 RepID=UPI003823D8F8
MTSHSVPKSVGDLAGVRVIITGGTRGIGAATVKRFLAGGAQVVTAARNDGPVPDGAELVVADMATPSGAATVFDRAMETLGGVDVLINNAGNNHVTPGDVLTAEDEVWDGNLEINLMAAVRLDRLVAPVMRANGRGCIVHVSTGGARWPVQEDGIPYAAAKAALSTYSKGLSNSLAASGVRVLTVLLGFFETESSVVGMQEMADRSGIPLEQLRANLYEQFTGPMKRPGRGEEAAELFAFLASSRASYLNGAQIPLDGGLLPTM